MKIIFLGINDLGQKIYKWLENNGEEIETLITKKEELTKIKEEKPDLVICCGFRHIIPEDILSIPPKGIINFHKSLLPLNRGANPNVWTIIDKTPAGVTLHYLDKGVDTGDIIAQKEVETNMLDTSLSLYEKLEEAQFKLFTEVWPKIKKGTNPRIKQEGKGSYHEKKDFKNLWKIDLEKDYTGEEIINLLRALTFPPFKNAFFEKNGKKYYIRLEIFDNNKVDSNERLIPNYQNEDLNKEAKK